MTVGGDAYCAECYKDIKSPDDRDFDMYPARRERSGSCGCCGTDVG